MLTFHVDDNATRKVYLICMNSYLSLLSFMETISENFYKTLSNESYTELPVILEDQKIPI